MWVSAAHIHHHSCTDKPMATVPCSVCFNFKTCFFLAKLSIAWDYKSAIVRAFLLCGSMCILHLKYTWSDGFSAVVTPDFLHNHLVPKSVLSSKGMY